MYLFCSFFLVRLFSLLFMQNQVWLFFSLKLTWNLCGLGQHWDYWLSCFSFLKAEISSSSCIFYVFGVGDWTQGFRHVRQELSQHLCLFWDMFLQRPKLWNRPEGKGRTRNIFRTCSGFQLTTYYCVIGIQLIDSIFFIIKMNYLAGQWWCIPLITAEAVWDLLSWRPAWSTDQARTTQRTMSRKTKDKTKKKFFVDK